MEIGDSEEFELQPSIWKLIIQFCPSEEQEEVERILGCAIVEQARELYCEACTHLEIWKQLKDESEERTIQRLPEPPAVRERLVQEIKFLLEHLEQKGKRCMRHKSGTKKEIEEYVKQQCQDGEQHIFSQSRPSSAASYRSPSAMLMLSGTEGRSSSLEKGISGHVTVMEIDSVIQNVRDALQEECQVRMQEVHFLQGCVEEASERRGKRYKEPSIQELREFGSELEKEIREEIPLSARTTSPQRGHHKPTGHLLPPLRQDSRQHAVKEQGLQRADDARKSLRIRFATKSEPMPLFAGRYLAADRVKYQRELSDTNTQRTAG